MNRQPAILSSWFLPLAAAVMTILLAAICVWQWQRETRIQRHCEVAIDRANRAEAMAAAEQQRADTQTSRNLDAAGRIEELNRAFATMHAELETLRQAAADREAMAESVARARAAIEDANKTIATHNAAVAGHNATVQQLQAERDELVRKLNDRTREYNTLVEKLRAKDP